jgi:hypothetical protein
MPQARRRQDARIRHDIPHSEEKIVPKQKTTRNERRLAKKAAAKQKAVQKNRIPRQSQLPGIEDQKIVAIENAALDYAEVRDARQGLTRQEVDLKKRLLDLMHAKELTTYKRNGISVAVVLEEETVKVRVKLEEDLDDTPSGSELAPSAESIEAVLSNEEV